MILERLLDQMLGMLSSLLRSVLPAAGDLNIEIGSGWLLAYNWLNGFLPISDGLAVAGMILGVYVLVFAARLVLTLWDAVPFKAS